ncbi:hypothetical protein ACTNCL_13440 [Segatella copri]|uniref:hypothetical protein n=1 Tax=Segatella copri TaxID=165179 RepID=UPI003F8BED27
MDKNKKVPEVRFKGFKLAWKKTPLSEYMTVSNEKNVSNTYDKYDIYSVSREYGVVNQIEYQGKSFAGASLTGYGVVHTWDVVYTKSPLKLQPYGIIKTNKTQNGIVSALYGVFTPNGNIDANFVQTYFELDQRLNDYLRPLVNKGAKNTLLISDEDAIKGNVIFPQKDEQEKIVKMFNTLDTLIRKLEQKLEKLRNIKQSLLKQMFINVNRGGYTPLIRFKGFEDEWSVIALNDISERITRKNTNNESSLPLTISAQYGLINQNDFFNSRIASKDVSGYYLIKKGEFAYNKSTSDGYPVGAVKRLDKYEMGVLSTLYIIFALKKEKLNSDFLSAFFETGKWHEHIYQCASEGARNHGLLNISSDDFLKLKILAPKAKNEQALISEFVMLMDRLVNESTDKLSKFRSMKHSLLQKMFI